MLEYRPSWHGSIENYAAKYVRRFAWKLQPSYDVQDGMQEAYIVFLRLQQKYHGIDTPQHFMALYKTALSNRVTDLAAEVTKHRLQSLTQDDECDEPVVEAVGATDNDGALRVAIEQAPNDVKLVLALMLSAPAELLEVACATFISKGRRLSQGNALFSKLLGLPAGSEPVTKTKEYFSEKT